MNLQSDESKPTFEKMQYSYNHPHNLQEISSTITNTDNTTSQTCNHSMSNTVNHASNDTSSPKGLKDLDDTNMNAKRNNGNQSRYYTIPTVYNIKQHLQLQHKSYDEYRNDGLDYEFGYAGCEDLLRLENENEYFKSALCGKNYYLKNRFTDVLALESSRVILKGLENDYINGNFIPGKSFNFEDGTMNWIVTQGPSNETASDFWYMIFQEDVKLIVMLCDRVENGIVKCAHYWPHDNEVKTFQLRLLQPSNVNMTSVLNVNNNTVHNVQNNVDLSINATNNATNVNTNVASDYQGSDHELELNELLLHPDITEKAKNIDVVCTPKTFMPSFEFPLRNEFFPRDAKINSSQDKNSNSNLSNYVTKELRVRKLHSKKDGNIIERTFELEFDGCKRVITHFQLVGWPDHGVPLEYSSFRKLMKMVQPFCLQPNKVTVHCSAGIGRSSTFIAAIILKEKLISHMQKNIEDKFDFEVFETVRQLRNFRSGSVQQKCQYEFIYLVMDEEARELGYIFPEE